MPRRIGHDVGQTGRDGLFGRQPAAVAVVFCHQGFELGRRASRTGGIDCGDARVGLAQQVEFAVQLGGVAFGGADGRVYQVEGVGRYFAAAGRRGLRDDRRRRGCVPVAAGRDVCAERRERTNLGTASFMPPIFGQMLAGKVLCEIAQVPEA